MRGHRLRQAKFASLKIILFAHVVVTVQRSDPLHFTLDIKHTRQNFVMPDPTIGGTARHGRAGALR